MNYRKLRSAWSVWWGILSLLLVVLWVRSYFYRDSKILGLSVLRFAQIQSVSGRLSCALGNLPSTYAEWGPDRIMFGRYFTHPEKSFAIPISAEDRQPVASAFSFERHRYRDGYEILVPYSFCALAIGMASILPWIKWGNKFSLQTLLTAVTLVAIGLGVFVIVLRGNGG